VGVPPNRLQLPLAHWLARPPAGEDGLASWRPLLERWRDSAGGRALVRTIDTRLAAGAVIYPSEPFRALTLTPRDQVKILILGQDPYHGPGQAEGLAFSVPAGQRLPPSLRNIGRELARDLALPLPATGSLLPWAQRGVLLLNTALTVEDGLPGSHAKIGWSALTDEIVVALTSDPKPMVFMLWGAHAQAAAKHIPGGRHLLLQSNHPSPLSASRGPVPFIGCGHFGLANRFLAAAGRGAVNWVLG
jgi:uracil-DNA glycosylase